MVHDSVDVALEAAERDAAPRRGERRSDEIERVASASSVSSTSSGASQRGGYGMHRVETQRDLERHQTELSRINTARSQHSGTVGKDPRSREGRKPLPSFGAGKPYPPLLPHQEDYVVEFDGPDDPLHAQNWPIKKKYVSHCCLFTSPLTPMPLANMTDPGSPRLPCSASRP